MEIAIVFYIILAGVIIYVLGEIIVKIVIDPVQELKRVIADVAFKLIHYSHVFKLSSADDSDTATGEAESTSSRKPDANGSGRFSPILREERKRFQTRCRSEPVSSSSFFPC